jgi:hypothetical protein
LGGRSCFSCTTRSDRPITPALTEVANVGSVNPSIEGLFRSGSFFCRFLAVTFVEAIHASRGVDEFLLTGKERVASGTYFDVQVAFFGGARFECLAESADNCFCYFFGVISCFN